MEQIRTIPQTGEYLESIRYLIVDEYQDVDDLQEKLIASIASAGANICVVGDDDQTIYQFRGSNAENMTGFAQRYPDAVQIRLEDNFCCAPGSGSCGGWPGAAETDIPSPSAEFSATSRN